MNGSKVLVHNFILFGFNRSYFFISPTSDGDVYIDKQIVHESLFAYRVLRYLVCYMLTVMCCYILAMVYIPGNRRSIVVCFFNIVRDSR